MPFVPFHSKLHSFTPQQLWPLHTKFLSPWGVGAASQYIREEIMGKEVIDVKSILNILVTIQILVAAGGVEHQTGHAAGVASPA